MAEDVSPLRRSWLSLATAIVVLAAGFVIQVFVLVARVDERSRRACPPCTRRSAS
jgi:hypothetical protein